MHVSIGKSPSDNIFPLHLHSAASIGYFSAIFEEHVSQLRSIQSGLTNLIDQFGDSRSHVALTRLENKSEFWPKLQNNIEIWSKIENKKVLE